MPPKRRSAAGSSGPASKKAKKAAAAPAKPEFVPPRSKRWSTGISGSANAEADYRMIWEDEERAYSYITLCQAFYVQSDDEDEDEEDEDDEDEDEDEDKDKDDGDADKDKDDEDEAEDEDEEEGEGEKDDDDDDGAERLGPRCEKKACVCFKPLSSNPEHPWVISWAGMKKFDTQFAHMDLRIPDYFDMYTFNDHGAYGSMEVVQNLLLDFEEAAKEKRGEWREQWAVCECTVHWLMHQVGTMFLMSDDGEGVQESMRMVGRMFLAMLAQLDDLGLVGDATAVKSLGCTMAMYMVLASDMVISNALKDDARKPYGDAGKFQPDYYGDAILTYANKRGVTLRGPPKIEEIIADAEGDVTLPAKNAADPWGFKAALRSYKKKYATRMFGSRGPASIGGDKYDITTFSPQQRKEASFDNKDPLKKKDIDALKKGMVMRRG
ncbi:hypothetical protein F5Y10DRAFT_230878 [Nemania abortiva]|nr:hypothetical protein F5Y10DRAFT_230878 [Nemania abortiva]